MAYSRQELEVIERELVRERERLVRKLARFHETSRSDEGHASFSFHMADEGTDTMDKERAFLLVSEEGRRLQKVDAALRRLYGRPESFGICYECSEPIGTARLEALPAAEYCIACQNRQETGGARE